MSLPDDRVTVEAIIANGRIYIAPLGTLPGHGPLAWQALERVPGTFYDRAGNRLPWPIAGLGAVREL